MDKAEAALRFAEQALVTATKALKAIADVKVIQGPKGDPGPKGDQGPRGEPGVVDASAMDEAHKGVWKEGAYTRGQLVTFGGSTFVCRESTTEKPETGKAWQLVVKRGRDGRDGKDGAKGERGEQGPTGHYKGIKE